MKKLDLSQYRTDGATETTIEDFSGFSAEDKERLLFAGIDVENPSDSGAFMHLNHSGVHCKTHREGLEVMDIKEALDKFDGLPDYYWQLVDKDKDEFTKATAENLHGGYFIRAKAGTKITEPVQSCLFIDKAGISQNVHNIVVVEEGAELHIISGCATAHGAKESAHLGISEFYVHKGGKLTFTMIHNWSVDTAVRPRSAGVLEEDAVFLSNYVLLKPVKDLQMYPKLTLKGENSVARFNSVIVAPEGSYIDCGNRIEMQAPNTRAEIIARTLTTGGTIINRGYIGAESVPARGHLECKGLILGGGRIHAIPELDSDQDGVELSHEAAVGKIAQEEIEYLMARGLDEDEATSTIVRGFLNVDMEGLPKELQDAIEQQIDELDAGDAM
ncbi:SufD family Fe-S cluster assembly protein [Halodesulfovibrio sp.]|jgi:Fe-S cluster assembly scaffold protein SufB|uniref:SufB/SufD family protein n=1 Tax=Halodesulfovibrio sp. TaxID=1912772 RepID=UPI0025D57AB4|nr:SufD family Fe-S cluster assembly protein [Halodesulfovibrio sp.]MCT4534134.1 SufD family Fe-S cluster assembly protein [Halodesulfovibrio sp.]MCT4625898.1 SufD family Fe-S cluster assembly protein [Halodesulfovibrio sp.]